MVIASVMSALARNPQLSHVKIAWLLPFLFLFMCQTDLRLVTVVHLCLLFRFIGQHLLNLMPLDIKARPAAAAVPAKGPSYSLVGSAHAAFQFIIDVYV